MNFPDASKLKASMGDLVWNRVDLYALLFQRLGNTRPFGNQFVGYMRKTMRLEWEKAPDGKSRVLPESLRHDEELQADLFHEITGPTMAGGASGHKRGIPYSWLVNHLMDARGQVSPRSFFAALVTASQSKESKAWKFPLDYKAIWNGVQKASQIRKNEIALEDYPWVSFLMDPLGARKLTIPCEESEIRGVWEEDKVIENLIKRINSGNEPVKLPPRRINDGARGLIEDLVGLGIMYRLPDRRIQIPDVFRIAYGLGRKGGVRPLK